MPEEYISPVGFAKEPSEERRRWIGRIFLAILLAFVVWLLLFRVFSPFNDESPGVGGGQQQQTMLPAPE